MKAFDLTRELRRIARREVPNGEPNLWPTIRQQLERAGASSEPRRSGADLDSSYVWHADTPRRRRYGALPAALAGTLVVVLLVAGLALALGNRGGDHDAPAGIGNVPQSTPAATPTSVWPSNGKLTIPVEPANGSDINGQVTAQLLPGGDLRLATSTNGSKKLVTMHLVAASCDRASADIPSKTDLIPPFTPNNGYYAFVPEAATHQPLALAALYLSDNTLAGCAIIPPVPVGTTPHFMAASEIPSTCPVTLPGSTLFTPPGATPAPPHFIYGDFWYGDTKLWTSLPFDGVWNGGKSFWWAEGYNFMTEPQPALTVTGKRLDGAGSTEASSATNGESGGVPPFMLVGLNFPTTGCWQVTGTYKGETTSFVVWVDQVANPVTPTPTPIPTPMPRTTQTPIPSIVFPVATPTPVPTSATCTDTSATMLLSHFIDAFDSGDPNALATLLPEKSISSSSWLAAVTTGSGDMVGDTIAPTRDDFLAYAAERHQHKEVLRIVDAQDIQPSWLPDDALLAFTLNRQADDLNNQQLRGIAMISCAAERVDSWSLGTMPSSTASATTGEALIEQSLRARPLHLDDIALTGGTCPVDLPHRVDPSLGPALGSGPLYVVMGQADENGVNHFSDSRADGGWYYFKVLWTSDPSYNGPVLVRGMQIDGSGEMRFSDSNPPDPDLYFTASHGNVADVTYTRVNTPGCYAYQVDGINFSELIVTSFQP